MGLFLAPVFFLRLAGVSSLSTSLFFLFVRQARGPSPRRFFFVRAFSRLVFFFFVFSLCSKPVGLLLAPFFFLFCERT